MPLLNKVEYQLPTVQTNIADEQKRYFDEKLRTKFMGVHITRCYSYRSKCSRTPGIILATNTPQARQRSLSVL